MNISNHELSKLLRIGPDVPCFIQVYSSDSDEAEFKIPYPQEITLTIGEDDERRITRIKPVPEPLSEALEAEESITTHHIANTLQSIDQDIDMPCVIQTFLSDNPDDQYRYPAIRYVIRKNQKKIEAAILIPTCVEWKP